MAWEEFVAERAQIVLEAAFRVVANAADAEDVAQEVFMEIFKNGSLSTVADQPALLRTIASRRALDRLRRNKPVLELEDGHLESREHEPSEYAIAAELDLRLRVALASLPPREAEVFCLSGLEGFSAAQIATLLRISKGAVAKALCSARSRLAVAFKHASAEVNHD